MVHKKTLRGIFYPVLENLAANPHFSPTCRVGQADRVTGGTSVADKNFVEIQCVFGVKFGLRSPTMTCATSAHPTVRNAD